MRQLHEDVVHRVRRLAPRAVYDPRAVPCGVQPSGPNHHPAGERVAKRRLRRHRRARWQRVLGRVQREGGVWLTVRGWFDWLTGATA